MLRRRILSLWFPRLAADRAVRVEPQLAGLPLAVIADRRGALVVASLSAEAEGVGLRPGMALGDARAIRPDLATRPDDPPAVAGFLVSLRRWAGRFTPWAAVEGDGLVLDITGCAHLFGDEAGLVAEVEAGAARLGLTVRLGLADTLGAAWALARYAGAGNELAFAGDAIDQEARATRSRAQKRRWERGGPPVTSPVASAARIAPPGETITHIGPLPVAALRLDPGAVAALQGLGLRRITDVAAQPRAALARRVGPEAGRRLDQALGRAAEPVTPAPPAAVFALRLGFPEPIGRVEDVLAGIDRLLPPLCERLTNAGRGLRRLRLNLLRSDGGVVQREIGLARPTVEPAAIRAILALSLGEIDAGFGLDGLRLEALVTEPVASVASRPLPAMRAGDLPAAADPDIADLIGRLGARLGLDALLRLCPADSHVPEKATTEMPAAFMSPGSGWPPSGRTRPPLLFPPEPITPTDDGTPPGRFIWRRRPRQRAAAWGPERLAPEWWLDDPAWRSGPRDYWRVETEEGVRLWLYAALGGEATAGWFAQGVFA
ncbi:protein ImuB [Amaricoccus macauensis]|uniref:Protein ImuB n=1 Tax=Amaricoccus macauensis TaxID=57001 RepID=A0A840SY22_9RHOB|nr:DNA polymerase Y family protein [Amaricoccus macauensis]MBB5224113.1 protein ImuB [Amaricoccus macauensis]